ncbi:hypothetical protein M422DRAFT_39425 [Sphaerobolus stellatus SS14]|uniref:Uncharacterized protein n=1 Tax=Sphaerobolus stellatus (strain SS14) TaxID=990650 RepID=A0A0C9TPI8_SPHS4|nr:hypothetical protein M422DRAFT_39425 [Sphaerobolus stellatus SS14]
MSSFLGASRRCFLDILFAAESTDFCCTNLNFNPLSEVYSIRERAIFAPLATDTRPSSCCSHITLQNPQAMLCLSVYSCDGEPYTDHLYKNGLYTSSLSNILLPSAISVDAKKYIVELDLAVVIRPARYVTFFCSTDILTLRLLLYKISTSLPY